MQARVMSAVAFGMPWAFALAIITNDLLTQAANTPRPIPNYDMGNPAGYGNWRPWQHYGAPHYGGQLSGINPPLSPEEFRSHFMFGPDKIPEVLACFRFPVTLGGRPGHTFAINTNMNGSARFFVSPETALLVFLKRMRTRGSVVIQLGDIPKNSTKKV